MRSKITAVCLGLGAIAALAPLCAARAEGQSAVLSLSEPPDRFVVDTGAGLVFAVSRENGDLISLRYNGRECEAPFDKARRYSHYASGLSRGAAITAEKDPAGEWVKITIDDPKIGVVQYYVAHRGENNIYLATYAAKSPPPGEMRFLTYLNRDVFTHVPPASDVARGDATVEGKDVFRNSLTGTTYSKFYDAAPIIDRTSHGITGDRIGCFMDMGSRETSSGGPFFRDIENQSTGSAAELYNYMFSGHTQTEPFRPGLKGPYALQFTEGRPPAAPRYAFLEKLGLQGFISASGRGTLTGHVLGGPGYARTTVALASSAAQYWATPDRAGAYRIAGALPGAYTETVYDGELATAKKTVTIEAGKTVTADIAPTLLIPPALFRIGVWDGTPRGFLNADKIADHHPSDSALAPFPPSGNFMVGMSKESAWPLAQWKEVNNNQRITFTLTAAQAATALTLRIGVTITYNDGRPQIVVNAGSPSPWTSAVPDPAIQPRLSRNITRGTFRGNNAVFAFAIPPGALHAGTNTIDIQVVSATKSFSGFLSPNIVFDALDLVTTADSSRAAQSVP